MREKMQIPAFLFAALFDLLAKTTLCGSWRRFKVKSPPCAARGWSSERRGYFGHGRAACSRIDAEVCSPLARDVVTPFRHRGCVCLHDAVGGGKRRRVHGTETGFCGFRRNRVLVESGPPEPIVE